MDWLAQLFSSGGMLESSGMGMDSLMSMGDGGMGKGHWGEGITTGEQQPSSSMPMMDLSQPQQLPSLMNEGMIYGQAQQQQPQLSLMEILRNRRMGY